MRRLAARLVPRLLKGGSLGVALTGSAARGTADTGSDLDLWVLERGPRHRRHLRAFGEPVTLLVDSPTSALDLAWLSFWEVDDLLVLADPHRHFEAVRRTFGQHRARLHRDVLQATRADLRHELHLARAASAWRRLLFLRHAGFRIAAVWLFLRTGWRVPRLAVLRQALPAAPRATLDALLALPPARVARPALAAVQPTLRAVQRHLARHRHPLAAEVGAPLEFTSRLRAGDRPEAVHLLRRHLVEVVLPAVLAGAPEADLTHLGDRPRGLRSLTFAVHGLARVDADAAAPVLRAGAQVTRLVKQLDLAGVLGTSVLRELQAAARAPGLHAGR